MRVHLEYLGISRLVIGRKEETWELSEGTTFRGLVRLLGRAYPRLFENVIQENGELLQAPNIFNLDGRRMIRTADMDEPILDGTHIVLMSLSAGG